VKKIDSGGQVAGRKSLEWIIEQLQCRCFSYEELQDVAERLCLHIKKMDACLEQSALMNQQFHELGMKRVAEVGAEFQMVMEAVVELLEDKRKREASSKARKAALALHSKPGNSNDKRATIRKMWASGKYSSRDECAEQECAGIPMSFSAARRALRNTPAPT